MYYHGLNNFGSQKTRVTISKDGLNFVAKKKIVGWPYFRKFTYKKKDYALSMPGVIYKNTGNIEDLLAVNQVMEENIRHSAVLVYGDTLIVLFTRKGDAPERIFGTTIDFKLPSTLWKITEPYEIFRAEKDWEGGNLPVYPSIESAINTPVNQIRDPAIFKENGKF